MKISLGPNCRLAATFRVARHPVTIDEDKAEFSIPVRHALNARSFRVGDQGGSEELFCELPLRTLRSDLPAKAEGIRWCVRCPPKPLRLGESRHPLGYFATNTPPPDFSCPAAKAPVAALFDEMSDGLGLCDTWAAVAAFDLDDRRACCVWT